MRYYLDASVVVANIVREPSTAVVRAWWKNQKPDDLSFSSWTLTEVASALAMKMRRREISEARKHRAQGFVSAMADSFARAAITETHFLSAARFIGQHATGLRSGDALHLAISADYGLTLVTLDQGQAAGAAYLGLDVLLLSESDQ